MFILWRQQNQLRPISSFVDLPASMNKLQARSTIGAKNTSRPFLIAIKELPARPADTVQHFIETDSDSDLRDSIRFHGTHCMYLHGCCLLLLFGSCVPGLFFSFNIRLQLMKLLFSVREFLLFGKQAVFQDVTSFVHEFVVKQDRLFQ